MFKICNIKILEPQIHSSLAEFYSKYLLIVIYNLCRNQISFQNKIDKILLKIYYITRILSGLTIIN